MRYCLACRRLSANGPLCTSCGRSFGGRLCNHKKGRHLNPPDANVCGQCGSTTLTDTANSIPFSWIGRLLLLSGLAVLAWRLGPPMLHHASDTLGITRYRDVRIWVIESVARVLMPLAILFFVFYGVACMVPGEGGKLLRGMMTGGVKWAVQTLIKVMGGFGRGVGKLITNLVQGGKTKT